MKICNNTMKRETLLTVTLIFLLSILQAQGMTDREAEKEINKKIFTDYDRRELPSAKVVVNMSNIDIDRFLVDESQHKVRLSTWMSMSWKEPRFTWNPTEFNNLKTIPVRRWKIWKPQLSNVDGASDWDRELWTYEAAKVTKDGLIKYVPRFHLNFFCIMDMTYWPYDTQNCSMRLRSWVHGANSLDFSVKEPMSISDSSKTAAGDDSITANYWKFTTMSLVKGTNHYACCPDPFIDLTLILLLKRNAPALYWTAQLPVAGMSVLGMLVFLMPPGSTVKMVYGSLCIFVNFTILTEISYLINHSFNHTPLLVQFLGQQLILLVLSLVLSVLVVRISTSPHPSGLPPVLKGPSITLGRIILLGNYVDLVNGTAKNFAWTLQDDQVELGEDSPKIIHLRELSEWKLLGAIVDRVAFLFYLTICVITLLRFSPVL